MGKTSSRSKPSTRADRKFEKKLQFYANVKDTVASLSAQKAISKKKVRSRKKKLKAYNLSSLSDFLPNLKAPRQPTPPEYKLDKKSRQNLVLLKEANQLWTVLNHPAFQSDPLASIHQHLQSTLPVTYEKPERKTMKGGGRRQQNRKSLKLHLGLNLWRSDLGCRYFLCGFH